MKCLGRTGRIKKTLKINQIIETTSRLFATINANDIAKKQS